MGSAGERGDSKTKKKTANKKKYVKFEKRSTTRLVKYEALPEYLQDNEYIRDYYHCEWPLKDVVFSIFSWHNETLNIWTHLVGFVIFGGLTAACLMEREMVENLMSRFSLVRFVYNGS